MEDIVVTVEINGMSSSAGSKPSCVEIHAWIAQREAMCVKIWNKLHYGQMSSEDRGVPSFRQSLGECLVRNRKPQRRGRISPTGRMERVPD